MLRLALSAFLSALLCGLIPHTQASEADHQRAWAEKLGGEIEVRLPDGTRCDIVTETHAIEVEFAPRWAEAIGQSLYYSLQTGKRAGVILILKAENEQKFLIRLNSVILHYGLPIDVWEGGDLDVRQLNKPE